MGYNGQQQWQSEKVMAKFYLPGDPRGQPTGWGFFGVFWVAEGPPERGGRAPVLRPARENFGF
jgi:hypothetical protein